MNPDDRRQRPFPADIIPVLCLRFSRHKTLIVFECSSSLPVSSDNILLKDFSLSKSGTKNDCGTEESSSYSLNIPRPPLHRVLVRPSQAYIRQMKRVIIVAARRPGSPGEASLCLSHLPMALFCQALLPAHPPTPPPPPPQLSICLAVALNEAGKLEGGEVKTH